MVFILTNKNYFPLGVVFYFFIFLYLYKFFFLEKYKTVLKNS